MTTTHRITRGFDIRLAGGAEPVITDAAEPLLVALDPTEFAGIKPKLLAKEGDRVLTGQPVVRDKLDPELQFCSPVTGKVTKVALGPGRALQRVEITPEAGEEHAPGATLSAAEVGKLDRRTIVTRLKLAGLWPLLRQRPIGRLVRSDETPVAIFVNGMDTEPLACDPAVAVKGQGTAFQAGIDLLRKLTDGKVFLTVRDAVVQPQEFLHAKGVEVHSFGGPHPAGLVGTHIARIRALGAHEIAYALRAQDVVALGQWVTTGRFPTHTVIAVAGTAAPRRGYFRVRRHAAALTLTAGKPLGDDVRVISGTVLTGRAVGGAGFLGYHATTLTCILEGADRRDMFGWALPQFGRHSTSRAVLSWLAPKKEYDLDARLNGGARPIVNIGAWEAVTPLDILPTFLVRAIQANDLEEAISLGLLEVTEEDVALCTFADPCKIDVGNVIRAGLDMYEKEGGS